MIICYVYERLHDLPQRFFFWFFLHSEGSFVAAPFKFFSKNVDFSLWGKQSSLLLIALFSGFFRLDQYYGDKTDQNYANYYEDQHAIDYNNKYDDFYDNINKKNLNDSLVILLIYGIIFLRNDFFNKWNTVKSI